MSVLSTSTMNKCQEFIDKVGEFRYLKVRERQINKFNRLLQKREGNITWYTLVAVSAIFPQAGSTSPQTTSIAPRQSIIPRQAVT